MVNLSSPFRKLKLTNVIQNTPIISFSNSFVPCSFNANCIKAIPTSFKVGNARNLFSSSTIAVSSDFCGRAIPPTPQVSYRQTGLKNTKGNETQFVAFLCPEAPGSGGQKIRHFRLKSRKTRKEFASELGVSPKTLWGWETDRWLPRDLLKKRIGVGLFL